MPNKIIEITQTASKYRSSIVVKVGENKFIDVKSILGLFSSLLGNQAYTLYIEGPDAEEAKAAMLAVFEKNGLQANVAE